MHIGPHSQRKIKFESTAPPSSEGIGGTVRKAWRWITIGDDRRVLLDKEGKNSFQDTHLTVQDLKNFSTNAQTLASKDRQKLTFIKQFIQEAYPHTFSNQATEQRFCYWLAETGDLNIALAAVSKPPTESDHELARIIKQLKSLGYDVNWIVDMLKENHYDISYKNAVVNLYELLKRENNTDKEIEKFKKFITLDPSFLKMISNHTSSTEILDGLKNWQSNQLGTLAQLDPSFLERMFSQNSPTEILHGLKDWQPDQLRALAELDLPFLERIFNGTNRAEILDSLKNWEAEPLKTLAQLDPSFLERMFNNGMQASNDFDLRVVLSRLRDWKPELLKILSKLDGSFIERLFNVAPGGVINRGVVLISQLSECQPEILYLLATMDQQDPNFIEKIYNTDSPGLTTISYLQDWSPQLLTALTALDKSFIETLFNQPYSIVAHLRYYSPQELETLSKCDPAFLNIVFKYGISVLDSLKDFTSEQLAKIQMLDPKLLETTFQSQYAPGIISMLITFTPEKWVKFKKFESIIFKSSPQVILFEELNLWPEEKLDTLLNHTQILEMILKSSSPTSALEFFRKNYESIFIKLLKKATSASEADIEKLLEVWLKIASHPDKFEITKNLIRAHATVDKILTLNPELQEVILMNVLNIENGIAVFDFLQAQKLLEGGIPPAQVKKIIFTVNFKYIVPTLELMKNYFDLPENFDFKPLINQFIQMSPDTFGDLVFYEGEIYKMIVRHIVDYLAEQDPTLPKSLQDDIKKLFEDKRIALGNVLKLSAIIKSVFISPEERAKANRQLADLKNIQLQLIRDITTVLAKIHAHKYKQTLLLNYNKLFNDPDINKWNNLKIRENIEEEDWAQLETALRNHLMTLFSSTQDEEKLENIMQFFTKAMTSNDAKASEAGKLQVRQRVASIIDHLLALPPNDPQVEDLIELLNFGGGACPDRVMVAMDLAEMYVKFQLAGPAYKVNVLANAFKKKNIERLVDPYQAENIETLLFYTVTLNPILQLGLPKETTMSYEGCAQKKPWTQVFHRLFLGFAADDFVSYVADNPFLQKDWKTSAQYNSMQATLSKKLEAATNEANASEEEITAYLTKELKLAEGEEPTEEQIQEEMIRRQKEFLGLKTYLLDEITKVYQRAGFVLRKPKDENEIIDEEKERAAFIQKKEADEAQNIKKWNKQLAAVTALAKQLDELVKIIPTEGIDKNGFKALVDQNKELQNLMEHSADAELRGSIGLFKERIKFLLSAENTEAIKKDHFTNLKLSLKTQEKTLNGNLGKSIQAYEKEIKALTKELQEAKAKYEGRPLTTDKQHEDFRGPQPLTAEEELLYYGESQQLANKLEIAARNFFKEKATELALQDGYLSAAL